MRELGSRGLYLTQYVLCNKAIMAIKGIGSICNALQSSKLHAAIGHFPCALLERPTVIPRVRFQRPIQILFAPSVLPTV